MPEKFKKEGKTKKAGASVKEEDEHLLSTIDVDTKDVEYEFYNYACDTDVYCADISEAFIEVPMTDTKDAVKALITIKLGLKEDGVEDDEPSDVIRLTLQALNLPNIWIGNTGVTKHSTKYKLGGINSRPSTSRTRGISGKAVKPTIEDDIPGTYCDTNGDKQFAVKLCNIFVIPESHYNLSITRLIEEGHKLSGNKKTGLTLEKNRRVNAFDIRVEMPTGVLWCTNVTRNNNEVTAGSSEN